MSNPGIVLRGGASGPTFIGSTPGYVLTVDTDGKTIKPAPAPGAGSVSSVFGRPGPAIVAQPGDYEASEVTNDSGVTGASVADALDTLDTDISGKVTSVFGRGPVVVAAPGDYDASEVTNDSNVPGSSVADGLNALLAIGQLIVADLAALALVSSGVTGSTVYVLDQAEPYRLDKTNTFAPFSPLIIGAAGGGNWFRRSKAYVVGNYTLWCQAFGAGIVGYTPGQLLATGATEPDIVLTVAGLDPASGQQDVCVDNHGNLWLTASNGAFTQVTARKFLLKDCLASGTPAVALTLTPPAALTEAGSGVFDHQNALWIANGTHGTSGVAQFLKYGQRQYSQSSGTSSLTLTSAGADSTSNQQDLLFDGNGNLWCALAFSSAVPANPNGAIAMWTAAQVAAGGAVAPTVLWAGTNFSAPGLGGISNLALAPNGLLWATCIALPGTIKAWPIAGAASGNPAPAVTLTSASFNGTYGLTFDRAGNLWIANGNNNKLMRIPAASLAVSGAVVPDVIISPVVAQLFSRLTFPNNPDRSGLLPSGSPPAL